MNLLSSVSNFKRLNIARANLDAQLKEMVQDKV